MHLQAAILGSPRIKRYHGRDLFGERGYSVSFEHDLFGAHHDVKAPTSVSLNASLGWRTGVQL